MGETVTADTIRQALEGAYRPPEWYLGFEVGNGTGASCRRHADAVAVNAYPSKGFEWTPTEPIIRRLRAAASLETITWGILGIERAAKDLTEDAQRIQAAVEAIRAGEGGGRC